MSTPDTDALRDALTAARPAMTGEQQDAADALLEALTPPMEEPVNYPAWVMARCQGHHGVVGDRVKVHARRIGNDPAGWECAEICSYVSFGELRDPRPLTAAERAEYGIPGECEPITDELVERCAKAAWEKTVEPHLLDTRLTATYRNIVRAVLRAAGHPEISDSCGGDSACPATVHYHGCHRDTAGRCDDPAAHL